jgi:peptidoglycan/LPS O-acetylase OafA/YrhL
MSPSATVALPVPVAFVPAAETTVDACAQTASWRPGAHIPALDGLRGIAILLVMARHAITPYVKDSTNVLDAAATAVTRPGWAGVDLFFVLSGFLITGLLLDSRDAPHRWRNFFVRRSLRIFPLYYAVLVMLFLVLPRFVDSVDPDWLTLQANQAWYWTYTVNFLNALTLGRGTPLNTAHLWSLSIEEQFYLVWPFVVWLVTPRRLVWIAGTAVVLGLITRAWMAANDIPGAYVLTPVRLDALMVGAMLAVVFRTIGPARLAKPARVALAIGVIAWVLLSALRGVEYRDAVVSVIGFPIVAIVFGAALVVALTPGPGSVVQRLLSTAPLRSWGKYSYGIYVFHYPIIAVCEMKFGFLQQTAAWAGGARLPAVLAFAMIAAGVSYGVAWVSYNVFEGPVLSLKRHFA